jgi:abnormal spindle-like microcephaly-associated protein
MKKFIAERVLSDPHLKMKYTRGKCNVPSGRFERRYKNELNRYILTKILTLTVFLDGAKRNNVIPPSVLLFQRKAMVKSSQDSLNILCRDYIAGIGNLPKYLLNVGVSVTYQQDPSEEFEFNVSNLATDLRDGVRLGKLAEILGQSTGVLEQMRLPAISRLQKVFNVGVSLSALTTLGVPNVDRIHPNYIVDGHRPQVLKMLWSIMTSFQLSSLLCNERLKQEIYAIHRTNESRVESIFFSSLCGNVDTCDNTCDLLLVWCQAVCSCYNYTVSNFSASFADGVALCLVLNFYHPSIVGLESILPTCASKTTEWKTSTSAKVNRFVENERRNCLLAIAKMKDIGGVPNMFPVSDSFNVPDERATIICVAYLCSRLLESSTEIRAIVIIQNAFRRSLKRSELHSNRLAVQIIEKVWLGKRHGYFRRQREKYIRAVKVIEYFFLSRRAILQQLTRERLFSTRIQVRILGNYAFKETLSLTFIFVKKYIRGYIARCRARSLRQRINTACTIQKIWRGFSTQRRYLQIRSGVIQFQTVARTFLAKEDFLHMLDSIVRIQCFSRRWLANQRLVEKWVERDHHCRLVGFTILCQVRMNHCSFFDVCLGKIY